MRYVSDMIGEAFKEWEPGENILISSPTGSGKSTFILKKLLPHAIEQNKHIVYLCNRKILHKQFTESTERELLSLLGGDTISADMRSAIHVVTYQFCETSHQFPDFQIQPDLSGYTKEQRIIDAHYHKLPPPIKIMEENILYYVFDEAHYFISDSLFNENIEYWFKVRFSSTGINLFLTATPEPFLTFLAARNKEIKLYENIVTIYEKYEEKIQLRQEMKKEAVKVQVYLKPEKTNVKAEYNKARDIDLACRKIEPYSDFIDYIEQRRNGLHYRMYPTEYDLDRMYTVRYFSEWETILSKIRETASDNNRWIVFVDSERDGICHEAALNAVEIPAVLLSAKTISKQGLAQTEFLSISKQRKFLCHVLIATSVMDCGVSIEDDRVKNIVIAEHDKTTFLQMLGRKRLKDGEQIQVYVKQYSSKTIAGIIHKYDTNLRDLTGFALLNEIDYDQVARPSDKKDGMKGINILSDQERCAVIDRVVKSGINHFLIPVSSPSQNQNQLLGEYQIRKSAYMGLIYGISEYLDAMKDYYESGDPQFFLKRQLSWINEKYCEESWVGYNETRDALFRYLEEVEGRWLNKMEQNTFSLQCVKLLIDFPVPPSVLIKDVSRYRKGKCPGLNKLNKSFAEKGIPFNITTKSRMQNGNRMTYWKITKT